MHFLTEYTKMQCLVCCSSNNLLDFVKFAIILFYKNSSTLKESITFVFEILETTKMNMTDTYQVKHSEHKALICKIYTYRFDRLDTIEAWNFIGLCNKFIVLCYTSLLRLFTINKILSISS